MPAYVPKSYREYVSNGTTTAVPVVFPYLRRSHVGVYINMEVGADTFDSQLVEGVGYVWANDTTITLTPARPNGQRYTVRRFTPSNQLLVNFNDGSNLVERDLDEQALQLLYVTQEIEDKATKAAERTITLIDGSASAYGFERVANNAALPASPTEGKLVEVVDGTGIEGNPLVVGEPAGFVGNSNLSPRLRWSGVAWTWLDYKANDPDARYLSRTTIPGGAFTLQGANLELTYQLAAAPGNTSPDGLIVWLKLPPTTPPVGFLYCNGSNKSRNQYPTLFSVVGTAYGAGDGVTTFGLPLEANLSNPFGDPAYRPFIKFGTRVGDDGVILIGAAIQNASYTFNVSGTTYTARSAPDVDSVLADQQSVSATADGQYIAVAGGGTDKLWTAIRNGNGWTKMTVSNPPTFNLNHVSIHPNGLYMIAIPASPGDPVYSWLRSGLTWGSRATVGSNPAALGWAEGHKLDWSRDGAWLVASGVNVNATPRVHTFASNVLTPVAALPAYTANIGPAVWHPSGLYLVASAGDFVTGAPPAVWVRSGTSFALIPSPTGFTSLINGKPTWNTDGTRLLMGNGYTGAGVKQWSFSNGVFTLLPTNITTGTSARFVVYPQSNTEFFDWSGCRVVSIKTGTAEVVATGVVSPPFGALRDAVMATTA